MMTNVKAILRNFCMSSSLKGLPKVLRAEDRLLRVLWLTGVMFGLGAGLYQTVSILKVFFEYNTNTHIALHDTGKKTFPDITVCKVNPSTIVGEEGNWTFDNYKDIVHDVIEHANAKDIQALRSIRGLFGFYRNIDIDSNLVQATLHNFLVYCEILKSTFSAKCQPPEYNFLTPGFPMCLTFKHDKNRHSMSTWSAVFYLEDFEPEPDTLFFKYPTAKYHSGLKVFLHSPGVYPNLRQPYTAGPGQETFLDVLETFNKHLPMPYSKCHQEKYIYDSDILYTYNNCLYVCSQRMLLERCGCLDPDMPIPKVVGAAKYCGFLFIKDPGQTVRQIRCWETAVVGISKQCNQHCTQPCDSSRFESQLFSIQWPHVSRHLAFYSSFIKDNPVYADYFQLYSNISELMTTDRRSAYELLRGTDLLQRNFLKLTVYFGSDRVLTYRDVPDMSTSTMTGSLGGILNLWMGLTFITAIELAELLIRLIRLRATHHVDPKADVCSKEGNGQTPPENNTGGDL